MVDKVKLKFKELSGYRDLYTFRLRGWRRRPSKTYVSAKTIKPPKRNVETDLSLIQILKLLVEIPSVTGDYEANHEVIEFIDRYVSARAMYVKRYTFNGFESLVATTQNTKTPKILLNAHADVVPGEAGVFVLRENQDKLYGRGTFDNKGAIAAFLKAIDALGDTLHDYDFGIMINTDEEAGGLDGALKLVEAGYKPQVCVCPDGGDDWAMETFARGLWHFEITAHGVSSHGSRPFEGKNAIRILTAALDEMYALFDLADKANSTINVGTISGGNAINQTPESSQAAIDIRFAKVEDEVYLKQKITEICANYGLDLRTEIYSASSVNNPDVPLLSAYADSIQRITGKKPAQTFSYAQADARHFCEVGIPCAITRPPGGGHHGAEEWVSKQALHDLVAVTVDYIRTQGKRA